MPKEWVIDVEKVLAECRLDGDDGGPARMPPSIYKPAEVGAVEVCPETILSSPTVLIHHHL